MDAIATSEKTRIFNFLPKQTTKKTPPENSHKLEDNETLENKRKNRQIHQGGFQSV